MPSRFAERSARRASRVDVAARARQRIFCTERIPCRANIAIESLIPELFLQRRRLFFHSLASDGRSCLASGSMGEIDTPWPARVGGRSTTGRARLAPSGQNKGPSRDSPKRYSMIRTGGGLVTRSSSVRNNPPSRIGEEITSRFRQALLD